MIFIKDKKRIYLFIHIISWLIMFIFPLFFIRKENIDGGLAGYLRFCIVPCACMIIFYVNYLYLIEEYLFRKKIRTFVIYNVIFIVVIGIIMHFLHESVIFPHKNHVILPQKKIMMDVLFTLRDMLSLLFTVAISVAIKGSSYWYNAEAQRQELERQRSEAELKNLKSQLNPHFLFNTLNNIYALIAISQEKSQQAVLELSKMLRYVLYDDNQKFVPLQKEVDFINNYISLMKLRLPENVTVKEEIDISLNPQIELAPLLFISLIENAFKHGVGSQANSFINIRLTVEDNDLIICEIANSYMPKDKKDKSGSGIGIENLRRRLELLYPDKHTFTVGVENDRYLAKLTIDTSNNTNDK